MNCMRFSLSHKLFVFIVFALVLTIVPLLYISETALSQFGSYAYIENKTQIENITNDYLSKMAEERANTHNELFKRIKSVSSMMAVQAAHVYDNMETLSSLDRTKKVTLSWRSKNQMFYNSETEEISIAYWGDSILTESISHELTALAFYRPTLLRSKQLLSECIATHIITQSGIGFYHTQNLRAREMVYHLPPPSEFDLRDGEPVTIFSKSTQPGRETQWTSVYKDDVIDGLIMTATTPIYDKNGQFRGVTGVDFPIDTIIKNLTRNDFVSKISESDDSFAFLQNEKGIILALPDRFYDKLGIPLDKSEFINSDDTCALSLKDSSTESIKNLYPIIKDKHQGVLSVNIKGEEYLWAIGCLKEVDWHVNLIVKKTDILESVQKTSVASKNAQKLIWKDFILHSVLVIAVAISLILYAIKLFISPIKHFIETTKRVAKGDYTKTLFIYRRDEIATLAKSLNSMIEKLSESEKVKKTYAGKLEEDVLSRTKELETTNNELQIIKTELEERVRLKTLQLKKLNNHLIHMGESERKLLAYDLHDGAAQTLALCIGKLKNLKDHNSNITFEMINEIELFIKQAVDEIHLLIHQLRPPIIDDFEIETIIEHLVKGYNKNKQCRITYINETKDLKRLKQEIKLTLYRAVNELIINILKHSKAKTAQVKLWNNTETIFLQIKDDGIGFDVVEVQKEKLSALGLFGISERLNSFGGSFDIVSAQGKGTMITSILPIQ